MAKRYAALLDERAALVAANRAIVDAADAEAEARDLTDDERKTLDANAARLRVVAADLEREEERRRQEREVAAVPATPEPARISGGHDRATDRPWASMGEFLQAVAAAYSPEARIDPRLYQAAASGASSGVPSDGGVLVHKDFSTRLLERAMETSKLAQRCTTIPIGADSDGLEAPIFDETSRVAGSRWGGVQVYRRAEADTVAATKPKFGLWDVQLEDLMALAYATRRVLRDASALEAIFEKSFRSEFAFKIDNEIVRGTGVGECLGILNAAALVSVAKETGQVADTIVAENIIKMWSRRWEMPGSSFVWLYNQDIEPQLFTTGIQVGVGGSTVFMPAGGISGNPYNTLFGKPMVSIEQAATLGDQGDIILADLSDYILIDKDGIQADQSMHVRFLYNEQAFRWIYRINGRPAMHAAKTPATGTLTRSAYVTLDARA